jgi:hypothetical protein
LREDAYFGSVSSAERPAPGYVRGIARLQRAEDCAQSGFAAAILAENEVVASELDIAGRATIQETASILDRRKFAECPYN